MLQIKGIRKVYKTGTLVQEALRGVSLNLRDNEFVAILGQSGSGKTTLLNIIGGLDRYNDGDLIINGVSTKKYSDRDWDSYRNHSVGFVFQSYNLIPHQSVLQNVELALTIGGIPASERTAKATEALIKVGLVEHIHKKPSQLSGGQMQRVAIARALVNDPQILLADEPTGALDSDTSLQVMDLLKEVAEDRLVVMVTHNPELAEQYATRIVTLKDGEITSDSDPYEPEATEATHKNMGKASMSLLTSLKLSFNNLWTKKARTILVSFAGSIGIIGIAMILAMSNGANQYIHNVEEESLQSYPLQINDTSFNLTSMYASNLSASQESDEKATSDQKEVSEWQTITGMLSGVNTNDLKSLKAYFESDECDIDDYVQTIEYSYNLVPRIYKGDEKGNYRQVNPETSFASLGISGSENSSNSLLSTFSSTDSFFALPEKEELFKNDYELKAGDWPKNSHECVLTLTANGRVPDVTLYIMGLKDYKELNEMIDSFVDGKSSETTSEPESYNYEDFLGINFKFLPSTEYYTYDENYKVWTDHSSDEKYINEHMKNAEDLKIVGVVQPTDNNSSQMKVGIAYHASLTKRMIELSKDTEIVKQQLAKPEIDVFTGKKFDDENQKSDMDMASLFKVDENAVKDVFNFEGSGLDFSGLDLSGMDFSGMDMDLSGVDLSAMASLMPELSQDDLKAIMGNINISMSESTLRELFKNILSGYQAYSADDPRADLSKLPSSLMSYLQTQEARSMIREDVQNYINAHSDAMIDEEDIKAIAESYILGYEKWLKDHNFDEGDYSHIRDYVNSDEAKQILSDGVAAMREKLKGFSPTDEEINTWAKHIVEGYEAYADANELPSASYMLSSFSSYLQTEPAQKLITEAVSEIADSSGIADSLSSLSGVMSQSMAGVMEAIFSSVGNEITSALTNSMGTLMGGISDNLLNAFKFNTDGLADMFKTEMSAEELKDLMLSLFNTQKSTYESNLKKLGYADLDKPGSITIYPNDFESKEHIKDIIAKYNDRMKAAGEDDKVIEYTDIVDALMGSITTIIDAISYVLIAFVAISLVVSSIMIGVITYISVLERRKEIGILRAIGASKRNISQVFNAETFIIGALAGVIGIAITELLIIPANAILHSLTGQENINAILPPVAAGILIVLSIVLTLIGGIIPSRKAAKSDPVTALRSE